MDIATFLIINNTIQDTVEDTIVYHKSMPLNFLNQMVNFYLTPKGKSSQFEKTRQ